MNCIIRFSVLLLVGHVMGEERMRANPTAFARMNESLTEVIARLDEHFYYCPELTEDILTFPENMQPGSNKRHEGCEVGFVCNDGFGNCGETPKTKCGSNREWTSVTGTPNCIDKSQTYFANPAMNQIYDLPCVVPMGTVMAVKIKPGANERAVVDILDEDNNKIVLHNSIRLDEGNHVVQRYIAWWNPDYRVDPEFVWQANVASVLEIKWTVDGFQIGVDGRTLYTGYDYKEMTAKSWRLKQDTGYPKFEHVEIIFPAQ